MSATKEPESTTMTSAKRKRVMTSAIEGQSVAAVRKTLNEMRKIWSLHSDNDPVYLTQVLGNGMTVEEFCFKFVLGHHSKRASKSLGKKQAKVTVE